MKKQTRRVAVIMAGGSGERFWPLSRASRPKQLLKLTSDQETLLEEAVNRILPLVPAENVFVSTSASLRDAIAAAKLPIPEENILAEPCKRNTAGCLCWVAAELMARYPEDEVVVGVLTADHLIEKPTRFRAKVKAAFNTAELHPALVTIGVKPDRPETGYGYIEVEREEAFENAPRTVVRFREKPNLPQAEDFLAGGNYFWNSGMFFWKLSVFEQEMNGASPQHAEATRKMTEWLAAKDHASATKVFETLPDISIDYALLERAKSVLMVEADFPWDDVGSWDALDRSRTPDENGNIVDGAPVLIDTKSCIVINEAGAEHIAVGVIGVENMVVIVSKDSVLVVPKNKAQEVRHIPKELKRRGAKQV